MGISRLILSVVEAIWVTPDSRAPPRPSRCGFAMRSGSASGHCLAKEKGFFVQEGVDVELIELETTRPRSPLLTPAKSMLWRPRSRRPWPSANRTRNPSRAYSHWTIPGAATASSRPRTSGPSPTSRADRSPTATAGSRSSMSTSCYRRSASARRTSTSSILPADKAAEAFMMQEVDAAVTWEPYLTEGRNVAHGHLLTDSSERPGLIGDCLATKASIFDDRKQEFRAVARAWDAAVRYVEADPAEANAIMAREMGGWLEDPAVSPRCCAASRCTSGQEPRVLRHARAARSDLPNDALCDRRLVGARDAQERTHAGRRDRTWEIRRIAQAILAWL